MGRFQPGYICNEPNNTSMTFMARWAEALHGSGNIADGLHRLLKLVNSDEAALIRLSMKSGTSKRISCAEADEKPVAGTLHTKSYANELLSCEAPAMRPGAVWSMHEALTAGDLRLASSLEGHFRTIGIREILVVVLQHRPDEIDLLELHFRHAVAEHDRMLFVALAPEIARCWQRRMPGTAQHSLFRPKIVGETEEAVPMFKDVLSPDNPANLSRCEFRICMLIRNGMSAKAIAEALTNSEATVRAHMSAIYAKTAASGQVELVHLLVGGSAESDYWRLAKPA